MRSVYAWMSSGCGYVAVALFVLAVLAAPAGVSLADEPSGPGIPGANNDLPAAAEHPCAANADGSCKNPGAQCYYFDKQSTCAKGNYTQCTCTPI